MFTGLIEDVGVLATVSPVGGGLELTIAPTRMPTAELALGESVAIDGVCLTVTKIRAGQFEVTAGAETLRVSTAKHYSHGAKVNLERALRLSDRLGGHLVQGHVDGIGTIVKKESGGQNLELEIRHDPGLIVVVKGSITIDGISLTVNRVETGMFSVALIPHTLDHTTLGEKPVGAPVNLEADMIGKYVQRLLLPHQS